MPNRKVDKEQEGGKEDIRKKKLETLEPFQSLQFSKPNLALPFSVSHSCAHSHSSTHPQPRSHALSLFLRLFSDGAGLQKLFGRSDDQSHPSPFPFRRVVSAPVTVANRARWNQGHGPLGKSRVMGDVVL